MHIFDPWLPKKFNAWHEWITLADGRAALWEQTKKIPLWLLTMYNLRKQNLSVKSFKEDAEKLYIGFNEALAGGNKEAMIKVSTPGMTGLMNSEMKRIKNVGGAQWKLHSPVKIRVMHLVNAKGPAELIGYEENIGKKDEKKKDVHVFCQITAEISSEQSISLLKKPADSVPTPVLLKEYVVFERNLSAKNDKWRIAGKLAV